jgi:hypothetical protein
MSQESTTILSKSNPIDALRIEVVEFVKSHEYFSNVPVLNNIKGDIESQINAKLEELGLVVSFETPKGKTDYPGLGSSAITSPCFFNIIECVVINRDPGNKAASGKTATDVVCELIAIFNPQSRSIKFDVTDYEEIPTVDGYTQWRVNGTAKLGWTIKT